MTWSSPRITCVICELDVVDDRGQRVQIAAVGAHQHRVRERAAVDVRRAAHEVGPCDGAVVEAEAPMRAPPLRLERRLLLRREAQRGAVVDRRQAAGELALAPELELVRGLVGRHRAGPSPSAARPRPRRARSGRTGAPRGPAGCRATRDPPRSPPRTPASSARGRCRRSAARRCRPRAARTARSRAPCGRCRCAGAPSARGRSGRQGPWRRCSLLPGRCNEYGLVRPPVWARAQTGSPS